jgi:hypothetical protein
VAGSQEGLLLRGQRFQGGRGRLVEAWDLWDRIGFWQNLGVIRATSEFLALARRAQAAPSSEALAARPAARLSEGVTRLQRFTQRARTALTIAQQETEKRHAYQIGSEHLLLGLIGVPEGIAGRALVSLGITSERAREQMESILPASGDPQTAMPAKISLGDDVKQTLETAIDEARRMGQHYVSTEHLLLGILRIREGLALKMLKGLGLTHGQIRKAIRYMLDESSSQAPDAPA